MAVRRVRVEFIRFGLLLVMTVALISVATRHDDHSAGRNQAARGHHQSSATPSPSSGQTEAPSQGGSTASPAPTAPGDNSGGGGTGDSSGAGGGSSGAGGGSSAGGGSGAAAVPTLPRTGGTQAAELAALASLFIAAGTFGMRISRPRPGAAQAGGPPAAATHDGQARGSSESNRPGTI